MSRCLGLSLPPQEFETVDPKYQRQSTENDGDEVVMFMVQIGPAADDTQHNVGE